MAVTATLLTRLYTFLSGQRIKAAEANGEFNQLVAAHNKVVDDLNSLLADIGAGTTALTTHQGSTDHDSRYNTKAEITALLGEKAPLNDPTFTGTVGGITKTMVGLANVDNTADADKPVSGPVQTALNLLTTLVAFNAHKTSGDHDARYLSLTNTTPFTPTSNYNPTTVLWVMQKISEAVLGGIPDSSITDAKMAVGNKKADVVAAAVATALPLIPPGAFDFDTPAGKTGWSYMLSGTGPVTEQYMDGATVKCSRVTSFDTPTAGKTQVVITTPEGKVITQVFNADGTANPITEV